MVSLHSTFEILKNTLGGREWEGKGGHKRENNLIALIYSKGYSASLLQTMALPAVGH